MGKSNQPTVFPQDWITPPSARNTRGCATKKRVEYSYATDDQALNAFQKLARLEGIIPALESSHAIAAVIDRAPKMSPADLVIVNLSGRGDKDVAPAADKLKLQMPK